MADRGRYVVEREDSPNVGDVGRDSRDVERRRRLDVLVFASAKVLNCELPSANPGLLTWELALFEGRCVDLKLAAGVMWCRKEAASLLQP